MEGPFVLANSLTDINNISSIQNLKKSEKVLSSVTFIHKSWADVPGDKERYRELAFVNKQILEKRKPHTHCLIRLLVSLSSRLSGMTGLGPNCFKVFMMSSIRHIWSMKAMISEAGFFLLPAFELEVAYKRLLSSSWPRGA